jgi:hypothetical protein
VAGYDLNAIADALADQLGSLQAGQYDGQQQMVTVTSEVTGVASVPAIGIELDTVNWDVTMARGADAFVFLAYLLVSTAESPDGQRLIRSLLSTGGLATSVKDTIEANRTLGGLVSYAVATRVRSIGAIKYAGVDYLGAVIEIEVVGQ